MEDIINLTGFEIFTYKFDYILIKFLVKTIVFVTERYFLLDKYLNKSL
jgi:hypothetical protein